jgi:hypothetical protein
MASLLFEHSGIICNKKITKKTVFIKLKNIKLNDIKDVDYLLHGDNIQINYFKKVNDEWEPTDKFDFEYYEVIQHIKKNMDTLYEVYGKKEIIKIPEETLSLFFRDSAVLIRVFK